MVTGRQRKGVSEGGLEILAAVGDDWDGATGIRRSNSCPVKQQAATKECQEYVRDTEVSIFSDECRKQYLIMKHYLYLYIWTFPGVCRYFSRATRAVCCPLNFHKDKITVT